MNKKIVMDKKIEMAIKKFLMEKAVPAVITSIEKAIKTPEVEKAVKNNDDNGK